MQRQQSCRHYYYMNKHHDDVFDVVVEMCNNASNVGPYKCSHGERSHWKYDMQPDILESDLNYEDAFSPHLGLCEIYDCL